RVCVSPGFLPWVSFCVSCVCPTDRAESVSQTGGGLSDRRGAVCPTDGGAGLSDRRALSAGAVCPTDRLSALAIRAFEVRLALRWRQPSARASSPSTSTFLGLSWSA